ncbi:MAG: zinc-binding dehydrogenase [Rhodospirillaceae bacterium]|nr:zinc-binding dehydrogenase [Rhodospirillaceae bacterium]
MRAMVTTGHGGLEKLEFHSDWPVPRPAPGEVLIKVGACGCNNTDINTRTAWYSESVKTGITSDGGAGGFDEIQPEAASWGGRPIAFPRIQGADAVGRIATVGEGVDAGRIGERVMVDGWLRPGDDIEKWGYWGSEADGGFAEFATCPNENAVKVESVLSDTELATFMVAFSTAEGMIRHVDPKPGEWVLVTGASGGVGTAAIQLVKRRGAHVVALCAAAKADEVKALGADAIVARDTDDLVAAIAAITPSGQVEGVVDVVGGPLFGAMIAALRTGGRYASSSAIAGPEVNFNLRHLVYRDLEFHGSTCTPPEVFHDVVRYIKTGEVHPVLSATYPLEQLAEAQAAFLEKNYIGKIVIEI